jgi:Polyketide cyclase / dehydrase and lipid transport
MVALMGKATESTVISASLAEVWDYYFAPGTWAAWVDGFGGVDASEGYPEAGGTLRWHSTPAGRGEVTERVVEHEPRRLHRVEFSDPESTGTMATTFEIAAQAGEGGGAGATRVTQEMSYRPRRSGPLGPLTDILFVRSQVQRSLARSLERLRREVEDAAP